MKNITKILLCLLLPTFFFGCRYSIGHQTTFGESLDLSEIINKAAENQLKFRSGGISSSTGFGEVFVYSKNYSNDYGVAKNRSFDESLFRKKLIKLLVSSLQANGFSVEHKSIKDGQILVVYSKNSLPAYANRGVIDIVSVSKSDERYGVYAFVTERVLKKKKQSLVS